MERSVARWDRVGRAGTGLDGTGRGGVRWRWTARDGTGRDEILWSVAWWAETGQDGGWMGMDGMGRDDVCGGHHVRGGRLGRYRVDQIR